MEQSGGAQTPKVHMKGGGNIGNRGPQCIVSIKVAVQTTRKERYRKQWLEDAGAGDELLHVKIVGGTEGRSMRRGKVGSSNCREVGQKKREGELAGAGLQ